MVECLRCMMVCVCAYLVLDYANYCLLLGQFTSETLDIHAACALLVISHFFLTSFSLSTLFPSSIPLSYSLSFPPPPFSLPPFLPLSLPPSLPSPTYLSLTHTVLKQILVKNRQYKTSPFECHICNLNSITDSPLHVLHCNG